MTSKLDSTNTESFDDGVPVALEDRAPGELRGAGARSPLFWKTMLVAMALMWGFSFCMMKDVLDALPPYLLLACRFLIAALIMLALFFRRIRTHFNRTYIVAGLLMGTSLWAAYVLQTVGLVDTTAGKSAFLTGTYCVLVPFIGHAVMGEKLTRYNLGAAFLCLAGIAFVALDSLTVGKGDLLTLASAVFFAIEIVIAAKFGRNLDVNAITFWMFLDVFGGCVALRRRLVVHRADSSVGDVYAVSRWYCFVLGSDMHLRGHARSKSGTCARSLFDWLVAALS